MENIPNKIYLQISKADVTIDNSITDFNELFRSAITWNDERINDNDIEFVRSDLVSNEISGLHLQRVNYLLPDNKCDYTGNFCKGDSYNKQSPICEKCEGNCS